MNTPLVPDLVDHDLHLLAAVPAVGKVGHGDAHLLVHVPALLHGVGVGVDLLTVGSLVDVVLLLHVDWLADVVL